MSKAKVSERLLARTAGIERPADPSREETRKATGAMSMPAQAGAFRIEAQKYVDKIEQLTDERDQLMVRLAEAEAAAVATAAAGATAVADGTTPEELAAQQQKIEELQVELAARQAAADEATRTAFSLRARYDELMGAAEGRPYHDRIALDLIDDSPFQPRMVYDAQELHQLQGSLHFAKQADPIKVRKKGARYELISGHRRVRALRLDPGQTEVDAIVVELTDEDAEKQVMQLLVGGVKPGDYESGKMYRRTLDNGYCRTQDEVAVFYGVSQTHVSACLLMLDMQPDIVAMLEANPRLLSRTNCEDIRVIRSEFPDADAVILEAVNLVAADQLKKTRLASWIRQRLGNKPPRSGKAAKEHIISSGDTQVFRTVRAARSVKVELLHPFTESADFVARLHEWLENQAKKSVGADPAQATGAAPEKERSS